MASIASRIMAMAKKGGPIPANRPALRFAMRCLDREDSVKANERTQESNPELENVIADRFLDEITKVLQPYFDDAESMAASVLAQREE